MPNITVTVSEEAYRAARVWAAQNDTSISAVVQYCIQRLLRPPIAQSAAAATTRRPRETPLPPCQTPSPLPPAENRHCETVSALPAESNPSIPAQVLTVSQNHSA
jgi:hypothetical protein